MKLPASLQNLSAPKRILLSPMLMISLVLHGVVLMLPMPSDKQKSESPKKEETVKITKLPLSSKTSSQDSPQFSQKPTPQFTSQGSQKNLPLSSQKRQTNLPQIVINRPVPQSNSPQIVVTETETQINSSPNKRVNQQSVTSNESQNKPQQNPTTSKGSTQDTKVSTQESQNSNQESTSAQKIIDFFSTFPRYPGAEKGSGGVLRAEFDNATYIFHTEDNLATVALKFEKEILPNQNFASPKLVSNEENFKVYEVSNSTGLETNYLYLISQKGKTAIYVEKENYTLAQLIEAQTEDRDNQLLGGYIITGINMIEKSYNLQEFKKENDFDRLDEKDKFQNENFDLKYAKKTTADNPVSEEKLISSLEEQLKLFKFEPLLKEEPYGKSVVYKAKHGTSETYLVLAPAKDEQGRPITVIVLAKNKPS